MENLMSIRKQTLQELLPSNSNINQWYPLVEELFPRYGLNSDKIDRIAGFIAQTGHESLDWNVIEENLNYSASALNRVFRKYFAHARVSPQSYHRRPEKIANRVYANRMGNGPEESGDGWRYRGRGLIQLSGKYNYEKFAEFINKPLERTVDYVSSRTGALESSLWFWQQNGLNELADRLDIKGMTRRINGGYNGYDDRKRRYRFALDVLQGDTEEFNVDYNQVLRIGSRGDTVRWLQEQLNLVVDGIYGPETYAAVVKYQQQFELFTDGIAGPNTLGHIRKYLNV